MLNKLSEWLCKIDSDKYVHLLVCLLLSFLLGCLSLMLINIWIAVIIAFFATMIAGVIKELTDDRVDRKDFIADAIGAFIGILMLIYAYFVIIRLK